MAHWDSKETSVGGLNGGGMTSALSSTHFSAALPQLQAGFGFPPYLYHGSFTNCVRKKGPWLALGTRRLCFFLRIFRITGRCVELWALVLWLRSLSSLTSPEYGNVGLSSSTAANPKAFIILLSPHHDFTCSSNSSPSEIDTSEMLPRISCNAVAVLDLSY
jgi:hypothetical protein